jgi:hypothetical protein
MQAGTKWISCEERNPEEYGKYRVLCVKRGQRTEDDYLWNGSYWVTPGGSPSKAVEAWAEKYVPAVKTETRALTLADYEARIHLYKEQIGTGYIGIGRTLIEAKEAKVVPHGQWESWVTETTGLTPRQAQRCMQAATEIREGSAMARLEMSKALMLLGSGLDEEAREEIAARAADEGATVKQLKEELRKAKLQVVQETGAAAEIREALKKAEEDRDQLERQMRAAEQGYKERIESAREDAYRRGEMARNTEDAAELRQMKKELEHANRLAADQRSAAMSMMEERDSLKLQIHEEREKAYVAGMQAGKPTDYDALKRNQADLLAAAEEAEKRASDAEAELEALRAGGSAAAVPAAVTLGKAVSAFFSECELMPFYPEDLTKDAKAVMALVNNLADWCRRMRQAVSGVVEAEGAIK